MEGHDYRISVCHCMMIDFLRPATVIMFGTTFFFNEFIELTWWTMRFPVFVLLSMACWLRWTPVSGVPKRTFIYFQIVWVISMVVMQRLASSVFWRPSVLSPAWSAPRSLLSLTERKVTQDLFEYMGVSKNTSTPKWMVYNGKPY